MKKGEIEGYEDVLEVMKKFFIDPLEKALASRLPRVPDEPVDPPSRDYLYYPELSEGEE